MTTTISGTSGVTFPAGGVGNPAGAVVGTSDTQTLTNKTLTTPNIDSAQIATVSGTAPLYMCRAWVNFNGTGTVAIRASGNVSSITDNGTGDYTVNITNAMSDANYAVCAIGYSDNAGLTLDIYLSEATVPTASLFRVRSLQTSTTAANDAARIHLSIFR